jgi:hypothetical protein
MTSRGERRQVTYNIQDNDIKQREGGQGRRDSNRDRWMNERTERDREVQWKKDAMETANKYRFRL